MFEPFNINTQHPDILPGEVYIGQLTPKAFNEIGWQTKRAGREYDPEGHPLPGLVFAVFVKFAELQSEDFAAQPDGTIVNTRDPSASRYRPIKCTYKCEKPRRNELH